MTDVAAPAPVATDQRLLGIRVRAITMRRWRTFRANRRGYVSAIIFGILFFVTLAAEFVANDRPILVFHDGSFYFPVLKDYPETTFGGTFATNANYKDPFVQHLIEEKGMTEEDFQAFTFGNAVKLWARLNPDFFTGTVVESQVCKLQTQMGIA